MTLWAVTLGERDYLAAPSSEAALAACGEADHYVSVWYFNEQWHAEEVSHFLDSWEPASEAS